MTIYEIDGLRYAGPKKIEIKPHPRFLSFVKLCVDNQEYSLSSDDLMRAIDGAITRVPVPEDEVIGSAVDMLNRFAEERAAANPRENTELPPG